MTNERNRNQCGVEPSVFRASVIQLQLLPTINLLTSLRKLLRINRLTKYPNTMRSRMRTTTAFGLVLFLCQLLACARSANAYRPVVLLHGIMTGAPSMQLIADEIVKVIPQYIQSSKPFKCTTNQFAKHHVKLTKNNGPQKSLTKIEIRSIRFTSQPTNVYVTGSLI